MKKTLVLILLFSQALISYSQSIPSYNRMNRGIVFTGSRGERLKLTPYGNNIVRIQVVRKGEAFFSDDHYEMVVSHQWPGDLLVAEEKTKYKLSPKSGSGILIVVDKQNLSVSFSRSGTSSVFLSQSKPVSWKADSVTNSFRYDENEHFTGLGHSYYGRAESLDLKGQFIQRNYGTEHGQQAPLLVPFYLSAKGYGLFVNSSFPNSFSFGKEGRYEFSLHGEARVDYFVIDGPGFPAILDRYTQLTGRPRLPLKAFFGLALSDKGHDHTSATPSDENWWKEKITQHKNAGFPLDHVVNDNRWRAGGGQRCLSYFDWDSIRYPSPKEYQQWIKANGLITTLDFNRCIAVQSEGWKPEFNIPQSELIDFNTSAPDFTKKEVRDWFWNIMWKKTLDPALQYPGDALWIDEFDEMGKAPFSMKFKDGTTWMERRNYWFFLVAKSLVQQGWDKSFQGAKRPFVWVRGMTAGAQRYATLWSGDIKPTYEEMKQQIRGMQLAGLSAFPFWGHDAGGFQKEPNDSLYEQWSMAMGCFSPFWKPHGTGKSRWPLDRSASAQKTAKTFSNLRYTLMPYTYTHAYRAYESGIPLARPMIFDYQQEPQAWKNDLQYLWGDALLVAPNCSDGNDVPVWLPKGQWFDFWNDATHKGGQVINYPSPVGKLPLFVKAGAIIPMNKYALSTAFLSADSLTIHVYTGADGHFTLYEDDGVSEAYQRANEKRTTAMHFNQSALTLTLDKAAGSFKNAPAERAYTVVFHGLPQAGTVIVNGQKIQTMASSGDLAPASGTAVWNPEKKCLAIAVPKLAVAKSLQVKLKP